MTQISETFIATYNPHLSAMHMRLALLKNGYAPPEVICACELGFGQGLNLNVHAAGSSNVTWFGNDLLAVHVDNARDLSPHSGAQMHLFEESFEQFCARDDLPDFEFIVVYGIWSWISESNRRAIANFIDRKLKPGGVVSISYNTLHGWMAMHPVRDLLREHVRWKRQAPSGVDIKIDDAISFVDQVLTKIPDFTSKQPVVAKRFERLKKSNRAYLTWEYFDEEWHPMSFSRVADDMGKIGCAFAGSELACERLDFLSFSKPQYDFLSGLNDQRYKEIVGDFFAQNPYRNDYWIKGGSRLSQEQQKQLLRSTEMIFLVPVQEIKWQTSKTDSGHNVNEKNVKLLAKIWQTERPTNLGAWADHMEKHGIDWTAFLQLIWTLVGDNCLQPIQKQDPSHKAKSRIACEALNTALLSKAHTDQAAPILVSPVTGLGVPVDANRQMFLRARQQGLEKPAQWAAAALAWLNASGSSVAPTGLTELTRRAQSRGTAGAHEWASGVLQLFYENGRLPEVNVQDLLPLSTQEALQELTHAAQLFQKGQLPILKELGIAT